MLLRNVLQSLLDIALYAAVGAITRSEFVVISSFQ